MRGNPRHTTHHGGAEPFRKVHVSKGSLESLAMLRKMMVVVMLNIWMMVTIVSMMLAMCVAETDNMAMLIGQSVTL